MDGDFFAIQESEIYIIIDPNLFCTFRVVVFQEILGDRQGIAFYGLQIERFRLMIADFKVARYIASYPEEGKNASNKEHDQADAPPFGSAFFPAGDKVNHQFY